MAYDKIVDSAKLDGAMTATADAIRGKTGKTADIPWDESTGFASEIASITTETEPNLQAKTATPSTSAQTIKPDSGYDGLSQVTVNAMPAAEQATPSIAVTTGGLITASATQTAGYVAEGTKSATKQLSTQAAMTVTPGTSNQTAVASGVYTTGAVTVKGDANLTAANIAKGVSIFGVAGSLEGAKVATGTFEITNVNLEDNPIIVSSVPFAPTRVVFYLDLSDYTNSSASSDMNDTVFYGEITTSGKVIKNIYGGEFTDEYDELNDCLRITDEGRPVDATMLTSNGFKIAATNGGYQTTIAAHMPYKWIALG